MYSKFKFVYSKTLKGLREGGILLVLKRTKKYFAYRKFIKQKKIHSKKNFAMFYSLMVVHSNTQQGIE